MTMANRLADMHELAPQLTEAVAKRITSTDQHDMALRDIGALVLGGVTSGGEEFTLHGLAPSTLMFSDRPERIVGHLTAAQFVDGWGHGENSFLDDPPNAVLSFLGKAMDHLWMSS